MTTPDLPEQLNISRSSTTDDAAAADPSPNGTTFYSLDEQDTGQKRQERSDEVQDPTIAIKQQKTFHEDDKTLPTTPTTPAPASTTTTATTTTTTATATATATTSNSSNSDFTVVEQTPFQLEAPDWSINNKAWAFLQSQNPKYPNKYLVKKESNGQERAGYLLGRRPDSDIR
jgi:hypothetical protein